MELKRIKNEKAKGKSRRAQYLDTWPHSSTCPSAAGTTRLSKLPVTLARCSEQLCLGYRLSFYPGTSCKLVDRTFDAAPTHFRMTFAFVPALPVARAAFSRLSVDARLAHTAPARRPCVRMVGAVVIAPGLMMIGVVAATAVFLTRSDEPVLIEREDVEDDGQEEPLRGVLGLTSLNRDAAAGSGVKGFGGEEVLGVPFATAGVAVIAAGEFVLDDEEDNGVSPRLAEELSWACSQVGDVGAEGVVVFDKEGVLLWTDGEMVERKGDGGEFVKNVRQGGVKVIVEGASVKDAPECFVGEVKTMVGIPVGQGGAVMVVGSSGEGFYGAVQERVLDAVVQRLQLFFFTDSFKNGR